MVRGGEATAGLRVAQQSVLQAAEAWVARASETPMPTISHLLRRQVLHKGKELADAVHLHHRSLDDGEDGEASAMEAFET